MELLVRFATRNAGTEGTRGRDRATKVLKDRIRTVQSAAHGDGGIVQTSSHLSADTQSCQFDRTCPHC